MKPCDCQDKRNIEKLKATKFTYNNDSIEICPSYVIIKTGNCSIKINHEQFEQFAKWYFKDQEG